MLRCEFQEITGLTDKAINDEQYAAIERAYMNFDGDKFQFGKWFYDLYSLTVHRAIEKVIHEACLEDKLDLIEGKCDTLRDKADAARDTKTWALINLIT